METNGEQPLEGPSLKWLDNVCDNLNVLKVRNWKELAMYKKSWSHLSEKAKIPNGL
jgi:hypothetical protein